MKTIVENGVTTSLQLPIMETPSPFDVKVPNFESNIPQHLLLNASPQDKWIMENLSILTQKTDWQTEELIKGGETFERIEAQTTKTNGRTTKNEEAINKLNDELAPVRFVTKWGKNKYVWFLLIVLFFIGIPYIASLNLTLKSFIGIFQYLFN